MRDKTMNTLLDTLQSCRDFGPSDSKDKVCGLLNIVSPRSEVEALTVNYDESVGQVYADTVLVANYTYG